MGCQPSKQSLPSVKPPQSTRGIYAPQDNNYAYCSSSESNVHAPRIVNLKSSNRTRQTQNLNNYNSLLLPIPNNNRLSGASPKSQNEQMLYQSTPPKLQNEERRHESTLRKPLATTKPPLKGITGRRRAGQSISNPNQVLVQPTAQRELASPSPVSSVGTTKWDRPEDLGFVRYNGGTGR